MSNENQLPRYFIEIDEEGFPIFDGLRVHDREVLQVIFQGLRRLSPDNLKSGLVTTCDGERCFVVGFSDPLVAQSVEIQGQEIRWNFLGDLKHVVALSEIYEDEWHRMHAFVGKDKIPAVLSRKAQADFLQKIAAESFRPKRWRAIEADLSSEKFWTDAYKNKEDGWELKAPSPVLVAQLEKTKKLLRPKAKILVPGAGRGHDAEYLEKQSFEVSALDFSPSATEEFKKLYPHSKLAWVEGDVFQYLEDNKKHFDAIFEHTLFCAIDPKRRQEYIDQVYESLKSGGLWFGVHFIRTAPTGPAFGNTQWELRQMTQEKFEFIEWELTRASHPARMGQELWVVLRARE